MTGPAWRFESRVTEPGGITITTTITVPTDTRWQDVREASELGQMGANFTLGHVLKSLERSNKFDEEPPF